MALQLAGAGGAPAATPAACRDRRGTRVVHPPAALPACAGRPWLPHWQPAGPQAAALCRSSLLDCARAPAGQAGLRRPCCCERIQERIHACTPPPATPCSTCAGAARHNATACKRRSVRAVARWLKPALSPAHGGGWQPPTTSGSGASVATGRRPGTERTAAALQPPGCSSTRRPPCSHWQDVRQRLTESLNARRTVASLYRYSGINQLRLLSIGSLWLSAQEFGVTNRVSVLRSPGNVARQCHGHLPFSFILAVDEGCAEQTTVLAIGPCCCGLHAALRESAAVVRVQVLVYLASSRQSGVGRLCATVPHTRPWMRLQTRRSLLAHRLASFSPGAWDAHVEGTAASSGGEAAARSAAGVQESQPVTVSKEVI